MRLRIGKWYLINNDFFTIKDFPAKYLGMFARGSRSFELTEKTERIGFSHNGRTKNNNKGKYGYCIFLDKKSTNIIKKLRSDEVFLYLL